MYLMYTKHRTLEVDLVLYGGFISLLATLGTSEPANISVSSPVNVARGPKSHSCTDVRWLCNRRQQTFGCHVEDRLLADAALVCRIVPFLPDLCQLLKIKTRLQWLCYAYLLLN